MLCSTGTFHVSSVKVAFENHPHYAWTPYKCKGTLFTNMCMAPTQLHIFSFPNQKQFVFQLVSPDILWKWLSFHAISRSHKIDIGIYWRGGHWSFWRKSDISGGYKKLSQKGLSAFVWRLWKSKICRWWENGQAYHPANCRRAFMSLANEISSFDICDLETRVKWKIRKICCVPPLDTTITRTSSSYIE